MRTSPHFIAFPRRSRMLFAPLLLVAAFVPLFGAGRSARAQNSVVAAAVIQQRRPVKPAPAARPKKKTGAQQLHDLGVLHQAHLRRYRADMNSSQEYAKRGDQVQADAMKLNAEDSRKKAENFKRQLDALLKSGRSRQKR